MLNLEGITKENARSIIIELNEINSFDIPPTIRMTDKFLVTGEYLFLRDEYGPLMVYNLKERKEVAKFMFGACELQDIATDQNKDNEEIYLSIKGGKFVLRNRDILLGKVMRWTNEKTSEGHPYLDGMVDFIGEPIINLAIEHAMYGEAKNNNVVGRIESFPLKEIVYKRPMLIWCPNKFTEENSRFLIHSDMDSQNNLVSGKGFVRLYYNYHFGEGGCVNVIELKNGKAYIPSFGEGEDRGYLEIAENEKFPSGIFAGITFLDYAKFPSYCPDGFTIPLNLTFKDGRVPRRNSGKIIKLQYNERELHVLRDNIISEDRDHGYWKIETPARLDSYKISFREIN